MWMRVLSMGPPMRMYDGCGGTCQQVDQTVVSVGPYMFHNVSGSAVRSRARSSGSGSPPTRARKPSVGCQSAASSRRQVPGVACMTVMFHCCRRSARRWPSPVSSRSAT